jgi:hypothetical protein
METANRQWTFNSDCLVGYYVLSVSRNERCYAKEFFGELRDEPIFSTPFDFLKDKFNKNGTVPKDGAE